MSLRSLPSLLWLRATVYHTFFGYCFTYWLVVLSISVNNSGIGRCKHRMNRIATSPAQMLILTFIAKVHRRSTQAFFYYFLQSRNPLSRFIVNVRKRERLQVVQDHIKVAMILQKKFFNVALSLRLFAPAGFVLEKISFSHWSCKVWKAIHRIQNLIKVLRQRKYIKVPT